jgi:hypothetical protein
MQKFNYGFPLKDDEKIIYKEHANMHDSEYVLSGAMYLTDMRIVFVSLVPNSNNKVTYSISLYDIREVKTEKSLFVFNNILRIVDVHDNRYKFIVKGQKKWQAQISMQLDQIGLQPLSVS